jgi:DNA-binding LacI/PurR family transcriptional regulator
MRFVAMPRITLREIARETKLSISAVSQALRSGTRISEQTRSRVRTAAQRLGYAPDPLLSALAEYRTRTRRTGDHGILAYLHAHAKGSSWGRFPLFGQFLSGVVSRASELGYKVEEFWTGEGKCGARAVGRILHHRGIRGLLVAPLPLGRARLDMEWAHFSSVAVGASLVAPSLHFVAHHHTRAVRECWRQLLRRRYRRVGLVLSRNLDQRVEHQILDAFLGEQTRLPIGLARLPPLVAPRLDAVSFGVWFERNRPDAIMALAGDVENWLREHRKKIPEDVGVLWLDAASEAGGSRSGIVQPGLALGCAAVDLVHLQLQRGERGVPSAPKGVVIDGAWREGRSLRPAP